MFEGDAEKLSDTDKVLKVRSYLASCDYFGDELDPDDIWNIIGRGEYDGILRGDE